MTYAELTMLIEDMDNRLRGHAAALERCDATGTYDEEAVASLGRLFAAWAKLYYALRLDALARRIEERQAALSGEGEA